QTAWEFLRRRRRSQPAASTLRFAARASLRACFAAALSASTATASAASLASRNSLSRAVLAASAARCLSRSARRSASASLVRLAASWALRRAAAARSSALLIARSHSFQTPVRARRSRPSISLALEPLAQRLARAAHAFRLLARPPLGRLLVGAPALHLAERSLALHLLFEHAQRCVDVVVANENLHDLSSSANTVSGTNAGPAAREPPGRRFNARFSQRARGYLRPACRAR